MKLSTFKSIEKWFYIIWQPTALILSIVYLIIFLYGIYLHFPLVVTKIVEKDALSCKIDPMFIGQKIKVDKEDWIVTRYEKSSYKSIPNEIYIHIEEPNN